MSGLRWAKFLFGPRICQEWGQSGGDADHLLLRRVCLSCLEKKWVKYRVPASIRPNDTLSIYAVLRTSYPVTPLTMRFRQRSTGHLVADAFVLECVSLIERAYCVVVGDEDDEEYPERSGFWRTDGPAVVAQYEACVANGGAEAALCFIEERRELVSKDCGVTDFLPHIRHTAVRNGDHAASTFFKAYAFLSYMLSPNIVLTCLAVL
ncbi:hypothetical protein B0H13DRAFT_961620 [Mycena leptocephala]|nr:hypothetical protein B0H13DRAFT_961620 [Mycena leptocephala]